MQVIHDLLRGVMFIALTIIGLGITAFLFVTGLITFGIMYLVFLIRGKKFSAGEYWQQSRQKAQQTRSQFSDRFRPPSYSRRKAQEITDVEIKEIK